MKFKNFAAIINDKSVVSSDKSATIASKSTIATIESAIIVTNQPSPLPTRLPLMRNRLFLFDFDEFLPVIVQASHLFANLFANMMISSKPLITARSISRFI